MHAQSKLAMASARACCLSFHMSDLVDTVDAASCTPGDCEHRLWCTECCWLWKAAHHSLHRGHVAWRVGHGLTLHQAAGVVLKVQLPPPEVRHRGRAAVC